MRVSRRRILTMIRPILFSILALFALLPVSGHQRPPLAPPLESLSGTVPPVYFGMHVHGLLEFTSWPTVPFGAIRFWDTGVTWKDLEPNKNDWHLGRLDRLVNLAAGHHVEVLLCFGKTPAWASNVNALTPNKMNPSIPRLQISTIGKTSSRKSPRATRAESRPMKSGTSQTGTASIRGTFAPWLK